MTTEAQLLANRRNAQKSTGPEMPINHLTTQPINRLNQLTNQPLNPLNQINQLTNLPN